MLKLLETACEHVTADHWKKVVEKTKQIIFNDCDKYVRIDRIRDQEMIISVGSDSESTSASDTS